MSFKNQVALFFGLFLFQSAWARTGQTGIHNVDGNLGQCESSEDLGNWGYIPSSLAAEQLGDQIVIRFAVVNLVCSQTQKSSEAVGWVLSSPSAAVNVRTISVNDGKLLSAGVELTDGDSWVSQEQNMNLQQSIQSYEFTWTVPGLSKTLDGLKGTDSFEKSYVFAVKGTFQNPTQLNTFQRYGGAFGLDLKWQKSGEQLHLSSHIVTGNQ